MSKVYKPSASDYIYKALLDELLLDKAFKFNPDEDDHTEITLENAEEIYDSAEEYFEGDYPEDSLNDIEYCFRESGEECNLNTTESSRHYEVDFVIKKIEDRWVGWNYWHGGGKHGEPEDMDWIPDAVFVNVESEEEVVQVVRTFRREEK